MAVTVVVASVVLATGAAWTAGAATASPAEGASVGGAHHAVMIRVSGSPLTGVTSTPLDLDPSFSPVDTDYVWYCASGSNNLVLQLTSGGTITADGRSGASITVPVSVVNDQAVVIVAPGGTEYWIRCLPSTFPRLEVSGTGTAAAGYYVTGTFENPELGVDGFPMVLNSYGTPVWYLDHTPGSPQDTELLPGTHTIAWATAPAYRLYHFDTGKVTELAPPIVPFDGHELFTDAEGDHWMISHPIKSGFKLRRIGFPKLHSIVDCAIQELNPQGKLIWSWLASDHVSPDEANELAGDSSHPGAVDVYHCNSIDVDPLDQSDILVSMRQAGVFLIDKTTGGIIWKLGGTTVPPKGGEPVLKIVGDPEGTIQGQHDARFQPDGAISLYDDHTELPGAARAAQYDIDTSDLTATMAWEYVAPSGDTSDVMGSTRRYDGNTLPYDEAGASYLGPQETVVDWGSGAPTAGFTVIDDSNDVLLTVALPKGIVGNRTQKVPLDALDLTQLHDSAGTRYP